MRLLLFIGPMLLVGAVLATAHWAELVAVALAFGLLQMGIVLINTGEDLPEDRAMEVRTCAVILGHRRCA